MYDDFDVFQRRAMATRSGKAEQGVEALNNAALGLAGESGEVCELIKKHKYHGHPLDRAKIKEELGDILWYIALACYALEVDMGVIAYENNEKLAARYPRGFETERSINR